MKGVGLTVGVVTVTIVLALGALAAAYFLWRPSQRAGMPGVCTVDDYFEGDAVEVEPTTVTTTIGNTTSYYTEWSTISTPTPTLTASSTFTTVAPSSVTTSYTFATTSFDLSAAPVGVWFVTVCTFRP